MKVVLRLTQLQEDALPGIAQLQEDALPSIAQLPNTEFTIFTIQSPQGQEFVFYGDESQFKYDATKRYYTYKSNYIFIFVDATVEVYKNSVGIENSVQLGFTNLTDDIYDLTKLPPTPG